MADTKLTGLPDASTTDGTEYAYLSQGGASTRALLSNLVSAAMVRTNNENVQSEILRRPMGYATRAELIAATVPDTETYVWIGDLCFVRDVSGTAITSNGGSVKWSPFGKATVKHFGAIGDTIITDDLRYVSGADDTIAIQKAIDWCGGEELSFEDGAIYNITGLTRTGGCNLNLRGATLFCTTNTTALQLAATIYGPYSLGANYVSGGLSIDLSGDPLSAPPVEGQVMKIVSNAVDPANRDRGSDTLQYRVGEFFRVGKGSTTTNIVLSSPLKFTDGVDPNSIAGDEPIILAYTTSQNARIVFASLDDKLVIGGGTVLHEGGNKATWNKHTVTATGYINSKITDTNVTRGYGNTFRLQGTFGAALSNITVENIEDNTANGQYGYGVADAGGSTAVTNLKVSHARHGYTSSVIRVVSNETDPLKLIGVGRVTGADIDGGSASGASANWDTHHSSEGARFSNVRSGASSGGALQLRGRNLITDGLVSDDTGNGIIVFTEYQSGDTDDDLFTASKRPSDISSAKIIDAHVTCTEQPLYVSHAIASIGGSGKYISNDHCFIYCSGGELNIDGDHNYKVVSGAVSHSRTGIIHVTDVSSLMTTAIPKTRVVIDGNVTIDATDASAGTVHLFNVEANSEVIVRGKLRVLLPSGAMYTAGTGGVIKCEGEGVIEYSVDGAADNTAISSSADLTLQKVKSLDGTVIWDHSPNDIVTTYQSASVVTHAGTGAEVKNVLDPDGQLGFKPMDDAGSGTIKLQIKGRKTGTNGDATIIVRSAASNYVDSIVIPSASDVFTIDSTMVVTASGAQTYYFDLDAYDSGTGTAQKRISRKVEAISPSTANLAFSIGVNAAVGDTIYFDVTEIKASAGGVL